jgi:hypothetical protein
MGVFFIAGTLARSASVVEKHIPQVDSTMHCPRHELRLLTSVFIKTSFYI